MAIARLLFFLYFIMNITPAWGGDKVPLVYIYCDYLTSHVPATEDPERGWADLVRRFETRQLINQKTPISENPKFQECVRQNTQLFETGEFIFEGKQRLAESLGVLGTEKRKGPKLISADFSVEDKSITSEYFAVILESESGTWTPATMESAMRDREKRYMALWKDFLGAVHDSLSKPNPLKSFK